MDCPVEAALRIVERNRSIARPDRQVTVGGVQVEEVADHCFLLVPQRNRELGHAVSFVVLHDMPDHGLAADLDQRLRALDSLFGQPSP